MKTTVAYIFCFSILLISCNVSNFGSMDLTTDLELGEAEITNVGDIEATFTVKNGTNEKKKYHFATGCQYAFKITQNGVKVFNSEENQGCYLSPTSFELPKNNDKVFYLTNSYDNELVSGRYSLKAYLIGYEDEVFASENFLVE